MKSLFIESELYHEETLYPLVQEKSEDEEDLVLSRKPRMGVELLDAIGREWRPYSLFGSVKQIVFKKNLDVVYFNTLESFSCILLAWMAYAKGIRVRAVVHNLDICYPISTQCSKGLKTRTLAAIVQRWVEPLLDEIYVLDDKLIEHVEEHTTKARSLPTHSLLNLPVKQLEEMNSPHCHYVGLLGDISYNRRSYEYLFELPKEEMREKKIRFVFLGNINEVDGTKFRERIKQEGREEFCIFFERYLSYEELFGGIIGCDELLMNHKSDRYGVVKIAAVHHLSKAFSKSLVKWDASFDAIQWLNNLK